MDGAGDAREARDEVEGLGTLALAGMAAVGWARLGRNVGPVRCIWVMAAVGWGGVGDVVGEGLVDAEVAEVGYWWCWMGVAAAPAGA